MKTPLVTILLTALALAAPAALALDILGSGSYLSLQVGSSSLDEQIEAGDSISWDADDEDRIYGLTYGYRLTKHIALELGYRNLGEYELVRALTGDEEEERNGEYTGWIGGVVVSFPVAGNLSLYGKYGLLNYDVEFSSDGVDVNPGSSIDDDDDYWALGAKYKLPIIELGLEYGVYTETDTLSAVLTFNF